MRTPGRRLCLLAVMLGVGVSANAAQLSTAFTYQGRYNQNGNPFTGNATLRFSLWDAAGTGTPPTGGNRIGNFQIVTPVAVSAGLFTVVLNGSAQFGATAFDGEARWLQIDVCADAGCNSFTTLAPRQALRGAPYALGPWNSSGGNLVYNNGKVGIGMTNPLFKIDLRSNESFCARFSMGGIGGGALVIGCNPNDNRVYLQTYNSTDDGTADELLFTGYRGGLIPQVSFYSALTAFLGEVRSVRNNGVAVTGQYANGNVNNMAQLGTTFAGLYATSANQNAIHAYEDSSGVGVAYAAIYGSGGGGNNAGVVGRASGVGAGVIGINSTGGYGGYFTGHVYMDGAATILGPLSKPGGSFKIDHPLDPENKYLSHSFVESPDMKNIYDGTIITDASGYAEVTLPEWFEALNRDFRYQLTVLDDSNSDQFVQAKIARKVENNRFTIRTSAPNVEVSWQVTGIRHDAWAEANRIAVETVKPASEVGTYLYPEAQGKPVENGLGYQRDKTMIGSPPSSPVKI